MEERLSLLKTSFGEIVDLKEQNITILNTLDSRIKKIKEMYGEFISSHRDNLFVFTLDSFHFQGKLIDLEYEDMNRMFLAITNRMYCDYYKLFKIMVDYVREHIPDKKLTELIKVHDNYPLYKDLEPFKQYDFQYIQSLHEVILSILTSLHTYIINKEHDLKVYQTKNQIGLNIDSFVNTFSFNNVVMNQKTMLFITYMEFFHKMQTKYFKRFTMKLNLMLSQINHDIKLDDPKSTKVVKNEVMSDLKDNHVDKQLLRELKVSLYDDASLNSSEHTKTPINRSASNSDSRPSSATGSDDQFMDISPAEMISELVSELTDDGNTQRPVPKYKSIYNSNNKLDVLTIPEEYENSSHSTSTNIWGEVVTNSIENEAAPAIELEIVEQENTEDEEEEDNENDNNIKPDEIIQKNSGEQNILLSENKKKRKKKKKKSIISTENITM
jgi:hypothetical protein